MAEYKPNFEQLLYERKGENGEVLWLTMNRPEMRNALTDTMQLELTEALERTLVDSTIRCVVLTGAGEKAFCSGGDISLLNSFTGAVELYDYMYHRGNHIQHLITYMDKPIIAAINGMCFGGGLELALCCDIIYASENAKFGLTEISIGSLPGWGGLTRLPRTISVNRAKEMILTGERIDAAEAYRLGLVSKVVPLDQLYATVEVTANNIIDKPPLNVRAVKSIINSGAQCGSVEAAQTIERGMVMWVINSEDYKEGTAAFLEKRKPVWKGK